MVYKAIKKIEDVLARINTHPEYSAHVRREMTRLFQEEAAKHSVAIELEATANGEKPKKCKETQTLKNLHNAWEFLAREGIDAKTLAMLGWHIEPQENSNKYFRGGAASFGGLVPPESEKIPFQIGDLVYRLETERMHPVVRAIEAHLEIVRIHPYADGNGRAARLVQNFCLQQRGYPTAIIPASERELYISILERTLKDRYNHASSSAKPSESEKIFQNLIAGKVLASAERLEEALRKRRMYDVEFYEVRDKGVIYSTAKCLRDYVKRGNGNGISASVTCPNGKRKTFALEIIGDISKEELGKLLERCREKYNLKYQLTTKTE